MADEPSPAAGFSGISPFPATQWSMVMRVQRDDDGAEVGKALNDFCRRYWQPVYSFLRCKGFGRPDAQDITQSFFLKAVTGNLIHNAEEGRGRLRSFLLGALERHLADHLRHERAVKRGGRAIVLPMECLLAEETFSREPVDHRDPEKLYLSTWAHSLIDQAREQLRAYMEKKGQGALFDQLQGLIEKDEGEAPYADVAQVLNTSETSLRVMVFRLRRRFGSLLRDEVAKTVETQEEIEQELAWLATVLRER